MNASNVVVVVVYWLHQVNETRGKERDLEIFLGLIIVSL